MKEETRWKLFADNDEVWSAILSDCREAKQSIDLEQFIFIKDDFSQKLLDICAERAAAGVSVRFLWDAAGSFTFWGSNIVEDLRQKGIRLKFWKTLVPGYFKMPDYRSWYLRDHRRTIVIDGKIGYTGSICVSDEMRDWRDTNARLEGPIAATMQNAFDRMWARAHGSKQLPPRISRKDPEFRYVTNYPSPAKRYLYRTIVEALRSARKYVYITTPYFVPTHRLLRVIKMAAHRGVDVRIILPEKSDHYPALDLGARSFFHTLLQSGVRIFLYSGAMVHSKAMVIDGEWATIGSLNLDNASLLYNFEANIVTTNSKFAEELSAHFVYDLQNSKEVLAKEWNNRYFIEKIPEQLIKLVRKFL